MRSLTRKQKAAIPALLFATFALFFLGWKAFERVPQGDGDMPPAYGTTSHLVPLVDRLVCVAKISERASDTHTGGVQAPDELLEGWTTRGGQPVYVKVEAAWWVPMTDLNADGHWKLVQGFFQVPDTVCIGKG